MWRTNLKITRKFATRPWHTREIHRVKLSWPLRGEWTYLCSSTSGFPSPRTLGINLKPGSTALGWEPFSLPRNGRPDVRLLVAMVTIHHRMFRAPAFPLDSVVVLCASVLRAKCVMEDDMFCFRRWMPDPYSIILSLMFFLFMLWLELCAWASQQAVPLPCLLKLIKWKTSATIFSWIMEISWWKRDKN